MAKEQLESLSEPMFYLLLALIKPMHGYEIMQFVEELTNGRVKVGPGTVYTLLARFEDEGYIDYIRIDGRRKIYRISKKGVLLLDSEVNRLRELINHEKEIRGEKLW